MISDENNISKCGLSMCKECWITYIFIDPMILLSYLLIVVCALLGVPYYSTIIITIIIIIHTYLNLSLL